MRAVLENVVDGVTAPDSATLRTALNQTERLSRLVAELLDLSRLDAGALTLRRERFAVTPLLAEAVAREVPTFGICLGGQLLAMATGGRVERNPDGPEYGAMLIAKRLRDSGGRAPRAFPLTLALTSG